MLSVICIISLGLCFNYFIIDIYYCSDFSPFFLFSWILFWFMIYVLVIVVAAQCRFREGRRCSYKKDISTNGAS